MSVTAEVSQPDKSSDSSARQDENMPAILRTFEVSNPDTSNSVSDVHKVNMPAIPEKNELVISPSSKPDVSTPDMSKPASPTLEVSNPETSS